MQSQIHFYRQHGYQTVFIAVPFRWNYTRNDAIWDELREGLYELGADHTIFAAIEPRQFTLAKYKATLRYGRRGTALDWLVAIGRSAQLEPEAKRLLKSLSVAALHVNHVFTLGFALKLKKQLGGKHRIPILLDSHDIQSHMLEDRKEVNPWLGKPDPVDRLLKAEVNHLLSADALLHLSVNDCDFFREALPAKPHFLAFPSIDDGFVASVKAAPPLDGPIDLLFVAHWHYPNLVAIRWFFEQVWPLISSLNYNVKIVGRIAVLAEGDAPQLYQAHRSCFVGEVADLAPYYRAARCVMAPMHSGSGISIKTIEALALGKAFVGTSKAYRGMPMDRLSSLGLQAFDEPAAFAQAIASTLANLPAAERSSRNAFDALFSRDACYAVREKALAAALQSQKLGAESESRTR